MKKKNSKIDPLNPDSFVVSKITGERLRQITHKHVSKYNMTIDEYCEKYSIPKNKLVCNDATKLKINTLENMIFKYGPEKGKMKWDEYCERQAYSNSYEYKRNKHGWTKEQYKKYNLSRAVTLPNLISRHGELLGKEMYENYRELQKYVGVKLEYFIEKYGQDEGTVKYYDLLKSKIPTNFGNGVSKISQEFFSKIDKDDINSFYYNKNNEFILNKKKFKPYSLDFYYMDAKKAVEFHGDYWHVNPLKYSPDYITPKGILAKDKWIADQNRVDDIRKNYNIELMVVWESEYYDDPIGCVDKTRKFLYDE